VPEGEALWIVVEVVVHDPASMGWSDGAGGDAHCHLDVPVVRKGQSRCVVDSGKHRTSRRRSTCHHWFHVLSRRCGNANLIAMRTH
jgi:hypothetical protein